MAEGFLVHSDYVWIFGEITGDVQTLARPHVDGILILVRHVLGRHTFSGPPGAAPP